MADSFKIVDNHAHIGWYSDGYHSAKEIWHIAQSVGVNELVVSSTTTCAYRCLPKLIQRELLELIKIGGESIHPILWVRPDLFKTHNRYALPRLLNGKVKWQGVKLHFEAHPEWFKRKDLVFKAMDLAKRLNVPVLFHSGGKYSDALVFERYIKESSDIIFVLAHGSPPEHAMCILTKCPNVFVDTAAMVDEIIKCFVDEGFVNRLLFGTDTALCSHIDGIDNHIKYVKHKIDFIKSICTESEFKSLMSRCPYVSKK